LLAIDAWTGAHQATKAAIEGRQVIEAGIESDGRDWRVGAAQTYGGAM
jgi:hypothetical protein